MGCIIWVDLGLVNGADFRFITISANEDAGNLRFCNNISISYQWVVSYGLFLRDLYHTGYFFM